MIVQQTLNKGDPGIIFGRCQRLHSGQAVLAIVLIGIEPRFRKGQAAVGDRCPTADLVISVAIRGYLRCIKCVGNACFQVPVRFIGVGGKGFNQVGSWQIGVGGCIPVQGSALGDLPAQSLKAAVFIIAVAQVIPGAQGQSR